VMAVFGAPIAHEDDAERAVRAGLKILEAIAQLNERDPDLELQVRVGINTGEAVVSLGARPEAGEGIVTGDVVNTAARIQSAAPVDGVAVAESTYRTTSQLFDYAPLQPANVKGKAASVALWQARAAVGGASRETRSRYATPLVGRQLEKQLLIGIVERAVQQRSVQLATLVGEPGVGKSRLCGELLEYVRSSEGAARWLQGSCLPYGEATAFWAFGEIVKAESSILESDSAEVAEAKLAATVPRETPDRDWVLERVRPLVGLEAGTHAEREELFAAWRRFVESLAAMRPTVLMFEDLHWADDALLAFLDYLVEWCEDVPLLVLCTARPELYERRPGWGAVRRNAHTINLSPLSDAETSALVSHLLSDSSLSAELERTLVARAGGNPLYAEEFVRLVFETGAPSAELVLPETVHALIAARLDTLSADRKSLLQDAAVFGNVFWAGAVADIGLRDVSDVERALHELVRKELLRPVRVSSMAGETEYVFWHVLVRDVAYSQLPRAERARRHRAAAAWLETKAGQRVEDVAEVLAHHYLHALEFAEAAGDVEQAEQLQQPTRRFLALAGARALKLEVSKAEAFYRRVLDLATPGTPERATVLVKVAEAAALAGRYKEAESTYEEAIASLKASGSNVLAGEALVRLAILVRDEAKASRAKALLDEAVALLEEAPASPALVLAYTHLARYYHFTWPAEASIAWAERAITTAERLGIEDRAMRARVFRGFTRFEVGDPHGVDELRDALRTGLELGLGEDTAGAYIALGDIVWWSDGPAAGLATYREGINFTQRRGMTYYTMYLKGEIVWPLFDLGEWDEILGLAGELLQWDKTSYQALLALPYVAHVHLFRGDIAVAGSVRDQFMRRAEENGDPQVLIPALAASALVDNELGNRDAAVGAVARIEHATRNRPVRRGQHLADAVRICVAAGAADLASRLLEGPESPGARQRHQALAARALLAEAHERYAEALRLHEEASRRWAEYGFTLAEGQALLGVGRCLAKLGRPVEAGPPLEAAQRLFSTLAAKPLLADVTALRASAR